MQRLLLFGATGLVGQQVLQLALSDSSVAQIVAPTRRPLPPHAKLLNPVIDFESLPKADWWQSEAVICALGTTIRQAGSQAQFRRIDHDYVMSIAQLALAGATPTFALVSSIGADHSSRNFYLHVKGELERDLLALRIPSLTITRPSFLDGERTENRPGERTVLTLARLFAPLIPRRYRAVSAIKVARALLLAVKSPQPGSRTIESDELQNL